MKRDLWSARHVCANCSALMKRKIMRIGGIEIRSWHCSKCGEVVLHPDDTQKMLIFNKIKKGIPVKVGALGESLIIRFPKEVADFYKITKGEEITLKAENKKKLGIDVE